MVHDVVVAMVKDLTKNKILRSNIKSKINQIFHNSNILARHGGDERHINPRTSLAEACDVAKNLLQAHTTSERTLCSGVGRIE